MKDRLEQFFEFRRLGTDWRTEIFAGLTTFVTMAYIIFVNPGILHQAGLPVAGVTAATCLAAAIGSLLMGLYARYPIALAPGMGLNAYFTYSVVLGMHVDWRVALGAVFLSGAAFLLLTAAGVRQMIVGAIPAELYAAVAAGVGLFIAFIGLRNAGVIVANPATLVGLGDLHQPATLIALAGLLIIGALICARVNAAILLGVLATWLLAAATGQAHWQLQPYKVEEIASTAFRLDIPGAARLGFLEIIFVFLFVDLFDNVGTLVAVGRKAGLLEDGKEIPRLNRILYSDAIATLVGATAGTSTVVSYIESSAGVAAGGRTGVTAAVTGLLFLVALFVAPLAGAIPLAATAPALIVVGSLMMTTAADIRWSDPEIALPAFLTMMAIPLTFSIANGLAFGFCS
jgi:AGZA family xanthine/uracil permease-like MFS transporter